MFRAFDAGNASIPEGAAFARDSNKNLAGIKKRRLSRRGNRLLSRVYREIESQARMRGGETPFSEYEVNRPAIRTAALRSRRPVSCRLQGRSFFCGFGPVDRSRPGSASRANHSVAW